MFKKVIFLIVAFFIFPIIIFARENVNDWYIKDFKIEIQLNTDSSALITEYITADCGNARDKHGIFRVLPININTGEKIIQMPIELISITDFSGKPYKYQVSQNVETKIITWKIGDANISVKGENYYKIIYKVQNVIYSQENFDEFYYNILGAYWDLEIDNFNAKIILPKEITLKDVLVDYYTGASLSKNKDLATYSWLDENTIEFNSVRMIPKANGITVSLSMPKNIFTIYSGNFEQINYLNDKDKGFLPLLLTYKIIIFDFLFSIFALIFCLYIWKKYGDDAKDKRTIIAEYDVPDNLDPILFGSLFKQGGFKNEFITAAIINFAVKGTIKIEEIEKDNIVLHGKDYILHRLDNKQAEDSLSPIEKELFFKLFNNNDKSVKASSLRNKFYKDVAILKKNTRKALIDLGYIEKIGFKWQLIFLIIAGISFLFGIFFVAIIFVIFASIMPRKTKKGVSTLRDIKGLKLYMTVAEKDRQRFYEKENIFEKLLPYAIVFGMTTLWIEKMKNIYGVEQFNTMIPAWYIGNNLNFKGIDSFTISFNRVVSGVSSSPHSSSGASGGGFSGGGGGGGGGGGW